MENKEDTQNAYNDEQEQICSINHLPCCGCSPCCEHRELGQTVS